MHSLDLKQPLKWRRKMWLILSLYARIKHPPCETITVSVSKSLMINNVHVLGYKCLF